MCNLLQTTRDSSVIEASAAQLPRNNYGDFVWWDMLFGTYENPPTFTSSCGFDDAREQRLLPMLAFRDVHRR